MRIERTCLDRGILLPDHWQFIPERRMGLPERAAKSRDARDRSGPLG